MLGTKFIECFKLLVRQNNNVCVCVWVGGCGWVGGLVRTCVRACVCVCTLLLLSIFLVFEWFLAPCFIEVDVLLLIALTVFM